MSPYRSAALTRRLALLTVSVIAACSSSDRNSASRLTSDTTRTRVDTLLAAGDSVYRQSADSAAHLWAEALALAERRGDSTRIARALTGLAQAARLRGDFAYARREGERALALKQRLDLRHELFRSYNALGLLARDEERLADATVLFERALESARADGDSLGVAKTTLNMGLVLQDYAQFGLARRALADARDRLATLGDSVNLARALNNLAALDIALGDSRAALTQISSARALFKVTHDSTGELNARGQLATAFSALGDQRRAFAAIDSALQLAQRLGDRTQVADNLRLTADMFLEAGDTQHALDYYARAAALNDSLGQREQHATILRSQARALYAAGNTPLAYRRGQDALREHRQGGFQYPALLDQLFLAEVAQELGRVADADGYVREARALALSFDAAIAMAQVQLVAARVASMRNQWAAVLRELDSTRSDATLAGSEAITNRLALRARAHARLGALPLATSDGRAAIAAIEQVRGSYGSGELRTRYAESKAAVYADLALVLLQQNRAGEAFEVADAARGRAILEHLSDARESIQRERGTTTLTEADALLRRIDALVARLRASESVAPRDRSGAAVGITRSLQDSLRTARSAYEALRARLPGITGSARIIAPRPAAITSVQATLQPDELLVEYFATANRLLVFAITQHAFTLIERPVHADSLAGRVALARALIGDRTADDAARPVLSALYRELIAPIVARGLLRNINTMVIVPHGLLTYLPFSALSNPANGRYLIEDVAILVAPSAAVLTAVRSGRRANQRDTPDGGSRAYALAPFSKTLPGSLAEVQSMRAAIPSAHHFIDGAASEAQLRRLVRDGAIVHVASHAVMNPGNPLFSRIVLAAGSGGVADDDGRLEVHEILGLEVNSPLVFLSGCETAVGSAWTTRFEGRVDFTSISHAWLVAGARSVIATLWRIDDLGAAELTSRFYQALERGGGAVSVAEALAQAQRAMIRDPRLRRPYLWAGYQVVGDGRSDQRRAKNARLSVSP